MAKNYFDPLDIAVSEPPVVADGINRPPLLETPVDSARQRFIDEIMGQPPRTPADKFQIIRESETETKPLKEKKNSEDFAREYRQKAEALLKEAHKTLVYRDDTFEPRVVAHRNDVRIDKDKTPLEIARQQLGDRSSKAQLETYAKTLLDINELEGKFDEPCIKSGATIAIPGQRIDGGITYRKNGITVTTWQDGSYLQVWERGKGEAGVTDGEGFEVGFTWNPENSEGTSEVRTKDAIRIETDALGNVGTYTKAGDDWKLTKISSVDAKDRKVIGDFDPGARAPHTITITDKDNNVIEVKMDGSNGYKGQKKNAQGEVIESDVRLIPGRKGFVIYYQKEHEDKSLTRTYESGTEERLNSQGNLIRRSGKDDWERAVVEEYKSGEELPYKVTVTPKGEKPIEFQQKPFGSYEADYISVQGEKLGTIELKPNGLMLYLNERLQTARAQLPDGTTVERTRLPNGRQQVVQIKDGSYLTKTIDREGTVIEAEYVSKEGRKISRKVSPDGESIESVILTDQTGAKTELKYDRDIGIFAGNRTDKTGKVLEKAFYLQGKLIYSDLRNGDTRFEKLNFFERDLFGLKISPGKYDAGTGTISYRNADGSTTVESFAPGRTDRLKDGAMEGTTVIGEKSSSLPTGETVVHHPGESGIRLNANNTVDRWGPKEEDNAVGEPLTRAEGNFLRKNPDIDKRDLLEIHRQFRGQPEKLVAFYNELDKLDSAKHLSDAEKMALRKGLMHHVAFPAELYQGNSWCCNVAVIQRDMAMNMPDKYVATIVQSLSKGEITLANGDKLPLDRNNLKIVDSTGRDMATRAFHNLALQAKFYPRYQFVNTEDGVGRLIPMNQENRPAAFVGLDMDGIADTRYKLTGEKKAIYNIASVDELIKAYELNKARSMTVAVNANEPPFSGSNDLAALFGGMSESTPNHVVSITGLDKGPPPRFFVQNQWGLQKDLSTWQSAVEAEVLLKSMLGRVRARNGNLVQTPGQALSSGEPGKTYLFKDGEPIEERRH